MSKKIALVSLLVLLNLMAVAQTSTGTISITNIQYNFNKRWFAFVDAQLRSNGLYRQFNYDDLKGGFGINVGDKLSFLTGFGVHATYSVPGNFKKPVVQKENRLWQQVVLNNKFGRLRLEHRYRLEQRWLASGLQHRLRYRLNAIVALNKKYRDRGTLFGYLNDEIYFINNAPFFSRNRIFSGIGFKPMPSLLLQVGYLHQTDFAVAKRSSQSFLQTAILVNLKRKHPAALHHGIN